MDSGKKPNIMVRTIKLAEDNDKITGSNGSKQSRQKRPPLRACDRSSSRIICSLCSRKNR